MNELIHKIYCIAEFVLALALLIKIITAKIIYKIKYKNEVSESFPIYLGFCLTHLIFTILHYVNIRFKLDYATGGCLEICKNLFYSGSFVFLSVFIFKMVTTTGNQYSNLNDVLQRQKTFQKTANAVYCYTILQVLLQVLQVGLSTFFQTSDFIKSEVLTGIGLLVCLLYITQLFVITSVYQKTLFNWILYTFSSLVVVVVSLILDRLSVFLIVDSGQRGQMILLLLRAPFLIFRTIQLTTLLLNLFQMVDIRNIIKQGGSR